MTEGTLAVVDYGMGNIHSILKALRLYHNRVVFSGDPAVLSQASALVLPGDGAFAAAMDHLNRGPGDAIREHVGKGRPLLGICIGFQVLFEDSSESSHIHQEKAVKGEEHLVRGMGFLPGHIRRFQLPHQYRVPHMGWNRLNESRPSGVDYLNDYMYFIHSYRAEGVPDRLVEATCEYGGEHFPAIVRKENIYATQFHPEKSDRMGLRLLEEWVRSL